MATSRDGFVAASDGRDDRLMKQNAEGEEHGVEAFKGLAGWSE